MRRAVMWSAVGLVLCTDLVAVRADQLAYNSRQVCLRAVEELPPGSFLISYCSKCEDESVEIWRVSKAIVVCTGFHDFYQVNIFCKKLYRSTEPIREGHFSDSIRYEELSPAVSGCEDLGTLEETDLAYIYAANGGSSYQCLGKKLGLKCDVLVDSIALPHDILPLLQASSRDTSR